MLKKTLLALTCSALLAGAAPAFAGYFLIVPMPSRVSGVVPELPEVPEVPAEIVVTLNAGVLPGAMRAQPYSQALAGYLQITGDPSLDPVQAQWAVSGGTLPPGLTLSTAGLVAGTPEVRNEAGSSFEIKATYKGKDGSQTYLITVGATELHATAISAKGSHVCAIVENGNVLCWGQNASGQLGDGTNTSRNTPVKVIGLTGVTKIAAGYNHTCAVASGTVYCWGLNGSGQLGNGSTTQSSSPVAIPAANMPGVVADLTSGGFHNCVKLTSGRIACWGHNQYGQIGNGGFVTQTSPVLLAATGVTDISTGNDHTCLIRTGGQAQCWGRAVYGQLGNNDTLDKATPQNVSGLTSGVSAIAGGMYHTCAILTSGAVRCWGRANDGQLGDGGSSAQKNTPTIVTGITNASQIAVGDYNSCVIKTTGEVACWGNNAFGQVGDGTNTARLSPATVPGVAGASAITLGFGSACALNSGVVKCWGYGANGQLGDGLATGRNYPDVIPY